MTISVVTNMPMIRSINALGRAQGIVSQAAERLATGKRINRASDDPAGLIAADNMAKERSALGGQISSAEGQLGLLGAREGALSVIEDMLIELEGLSVEAANGDALSIEEREGLQIQAESIYKTIDFLIETTSFKGKRILADSSMVSFGSRTQVINGLKIGDLGGVSREVKNKQGETVTESFSLKNIFNDLNFVDGDVGLASESVGGARETITKMRAGIGVQIQRVESDVRVWGGRMDKLAEIESEIRDADFAQETANLIRGQMLEQAALAMMQVAAQIPKAALQLLPSVGPLRPGLFR
jgi:flagellin